LQFDQTIVEIITIVFSFEQHGIYTTTQLNNTVLVVLPESLYVGHKQGHPIVAECLRMQRASLDERRQNNWKVI